MTGSRNRRRGGPVSLALVQHAHQYLVTDGYDNREGITQVLDAFTTVMSLHLKYRVPLNLHASGMLLEAVAWHRPDFFGWLAALRREGLLELIGSAYAQNIMPLFDGDHNRRQLVEGLGDYARLLGADPLEVRGFWVPERVWNTEAIAPVIGDGSLPNGGYRYVLLDDRLALRGPAARARFDAGAPPARGGRGNAASRSITRDHLHPYLIEGTDGLAALPISVDLRYSVPPREGEQWARIRAALRATADAGEGAIAVFADDLERSAAVGPWTSGSWRREGVSPYERFLAWIAREQRLEAVLLSPWLEAHRPADTRPIEPGTYYELAHQMKAGETYRRWWHAPAWAPYRETLQGVEAALRSAGAQPRTGGLVDLAWKQLLACSFETAWHDVGPDGAPAPAPWARATASHARDALPMLAAARWMDARDGSAHAELLDLDGDGEEELVLKNDHLFAVITPEYGGRLVALFDLDAPGGRQVIGNPADDWNWQEELNQFMLVPRNHPGACADVGHENDRWRVRRLVAQGSRADAVLVNRESGPLRGAAKRFRLRRGARALEVAYRLPAAPERHRIEFAFSPDYLALLRNGRTALERLESPQRRGWRRGGVSVWVRIPRAQPLVWDVPLHAEAGHAMVECIAAYGQRFGFRIGIGE